MPCFDIFCSIYIRFAGAVLKIWTNVQLSVFLCWMQLVRDRYISVLFLCDFLSPFLLGFSNETENTNLTFLYSALALSKSDEKDFSAATRLHFWIKTSQLNFQTAALFFVSSIIWRKSCVTCLKMNSKMIAPTQPAETLLSKCQIPIIDLAHIGKSCIVNLYLLLLDTLNFTGG